MFLPADQAIITAEDIAADSGADVDVVRAVMESCAQRFDDSVPPARRVYDLLTSSNPFQITPLVSDGAGNYVETTNGVGLDSLRRSVETALAGTTQFHRYDKKVRQIVSERLAVSSLEKVLRTPPRLTGFTRTARPTTTKPFPPRPRLRKPEYRREAGRRRRPVHRRRCRHLRRSQGKSMASAARRGDVRRLWSDLKATIGDGCKQAARLQALIETNAGLWLEDGTWLDLSEDSRSAVGRRAPRRHRSPRHQPWRSSRNRTASRRRHTVGHVPARPRNHRPGLRPPVQFLLCLRRRTDSDVATYYKASDELASRCSS